MHLSVGKQAARNAFTKAVTAVAQEYRLVRPIAAERITVAMRAFAESPAASPVDHRPIHPATWLNQGRYDDDPDVWHRQNAVGFAQQRVQGTQLAIEDFANG